MIAGHCTTSKCGSDLEGTTDRQSPKQATDEAANDFYAAKKVTDEAANNASCEVSINTASPSQNSYSGYNGPRTVQRHRPVVPDISNAGDGVSVASQRSPRKSGTVQHVGAFTSGISFDYSTDLATRFTVSSPHDISWAHAVNTREKLTRALHNSRTHMLEVDVQWGTYDPVAATTSASSAVASCTGTRSKRNRTLVCCHPPFTTSDLTLIELLSLVCEHNDKCNATTSLARMTHASLSGLEDDAPLLPPVRHLTPKGIKLDFKSNSVIAKAIDLCDKMNVCDRVPTLWLNADVLAGPGVLYGVSVIPGVSFVKHCAALPAAVVSLSWKATEYSMVHSSYSTEMVDGMLQLLRQVRIQNAHVTFAVSATYTVPSLPEFERLLGECRAQQLSASLTVWTGIGSSGISQRMKEEILETTKKREIGIFMDVITRKPGRTCNSVCVIA
eukprot:GEMP01012236.1.p1 GENE.GEMP01012236.1~~GEMP01012236.1.p1  ORF type:complete len:444 (+),score=100.56 GEMP01012236.1:79-1410(+)